ncbi:MAG: SWIB/MDM2 domain-containing protein [Candidatus Diapherotrites archaeon]|nr:SWIB/MDM2 domain-containing protein [Candidatus Diapherotrites archaeon]
MATVIGAPKKKPFGGYSISFKGCSDTLESVFGSGNIAPSEMTKLLWVYVKKNNLSGKK